MFRWIIPDDIWKNFKLDTIIYIQAIIYSVFGEKFVFYPEVPWEEFNEFHYYNDYPTVVDRTAGM